MERLVYLRQSSPGQTIFCPKAVLMRLQMDALLPLLLNFLDEQDATAKAIVKLVAEYCSRFSNSNCLQEVLKRIDSKNVAQRKNAFDVIADIIHMSSGSDSALSRAMWQHVTNRLLKCLEDVDLIIQSQAANLIPKIVPPLVLPALVDMSYSTIDKVQLSASTTLIALLINHRQEPEILCMLIDCLSNLCEGSDLSGSPSNSKEVAAPRHPSCRRQQQQLARVFPQAPALFLCRIGVKQGSIQRLFLLSSCASLCPIVLVLAEIWSFSSHVYLCTSHDKDLKLIPKRINMT